MKHTNFIPIDSILQRGTTREKRVDKHSKNGWMQKLGFIFTFLLCFSIGSFAQETWIGVTDGDWTKNSNWIDGTAPLSGVISGTGILTINGGAVNAPTTNIPTTVFATQLLVNSHLTIPEGVTFNIDGSSLALDGVVTMYYPTVLTVLGTLNVDDAGGDGIEVGQDSSSLLNLGTINIDDSGANGILLTGTGSSVNDGSLTILMSGNNGIQVNSTSTIFDNRVGSDLSIEESTNDGIQNAGLFENSEDISIEESGIHGIANTNSGTFLNDSLAVIAITNAAQDGINTGGTFINEGGEINVGNGNLAGIGDDGIEVRRGTFDSYSTVSYGGGEITINGTTSDGLLIGNTGIFTNGALGVGDSLGILLIDNVNGNGIQLEGTLDNIQKSIIEVGLNGGNVRQVALIGGGTVNNEDGSSMRLDADISSASTTGDITNNGILELFKTSDFMAPGLVNNAIIKSNAPPFSISGDIYNFGIIIDPNNSFGSDLDARTDVLTSNDGVIVAPYTAECFTEEIDDFLITDLSNADLAIFDYLPSSPFRMPGNPNAATMDAANNVLILNMVQSLMNFEYTATVLGTDCSVLGNVSISFDNVTSPAVACNDNIQISLNASCLAVLTPDVILEGDYPCYDGFTIELLEGANAGNDTIDASYLGQTSRVKVTSPLGNSCWGTVTVEDKIPPILTCRDTTLLCNTPTDPAVIGGQPAEVNSCNNAVTFTYSDEIENFACKVGTGPYPDTISRITRTWRGTDTNGNYSTCVQTIHIVKPQLKMPDIIWPANDTLYCGDNPSTDPSVTGVPMILFNGDTVNINEFCLFGINYQDQEFTTNCPSERKILRTWSIFDWCRPNVVLSNVLRPGGPQLIKIVDTVGPEITNLPFDTEIDILFTNLNSCKADLRVPAITVSDVCSGETITVTVSAGLSTINTNGGIITDVPFGLQTVTYTATDACGNSSSDTVNVLINDNIAPTVICKENLVVALTQNGTAQVIAEAFDNGSYDNCYLDSIRVRRMDSCGVAMTFPFSKYVNFECCDVGQEVMVQLGVWDSTGNFNSCMVIVQVQDKIVPVINCPPDITVDCDTNLTNLAIFGPANVTGGICNNASLDLVETRNLDNCGTGTISRTWTVSGTTVSCTQTITVTLVNNDSFNITRMPQPLIYVNCSEGVDIENLGQDSLQVESLGCQLLAVSYSQKVFNTPGDCKKVLRSWEIIDWCRNPQANPDLDGYQLVTQIVKLTDTIAPTFTNAVDTFEVFVEHDACSATVTLPTFIAVDSCGTSAGGPISVQAVNSPITINGTLTLSGGTTNTLTNATGGTSIANVAVGNYTVFYTATDYCNNSTIVPLVISVKDNQGPTIFCDDLVTTLTLNANEPAGSVNRGWITVWASDFNCKINDCDTSGIIQVIRFPTEGVGATSPPSDTSFGWTFNCDNLGPQVGDLWVRDGSGNWDYVRVTVDIQDNMSVCENRFGAMISGTIETELGESVEEVTVSIDGYTMSPTITGIDGNYQFEHLPMYSNYTVAPEKNMEPLNGVSTFDLVLISKHILGLNKLDSPYKQIAADVNRSGTITAYDLVQLRQLILNVTTEFSNNNSWRFIDSEYAFISDNPAAETFSEVASIGNLSENTEAHFIAVKIGDVNTNAIANRGLLTGESRTNKGTLAFLTEEVDFDKGAIFNVDFKLVDLGSVEGYQFTLNFDLSKVEIISVDEGIAQTSNFGLHLIDRGKLTTSWNQGSNVIQGEERMFSIALRAKQKGNLSEIISINSDITLAEAYDTSGEILDIALEFKGNKVGESIFALHNNKPNPFKEATTISFDLPEAGNAKLTVFDISGRILNTIDRDFDKGYNEIQIGKAALKGSGIYFYQLETAKNTAKKKMILID